MRSQTLARTHEKKKARQILQMQVERVCKQDDESKQTNEKKKRSERIETASNTQKIYRECR